LSTSSVLTGQIVVGEERASLNSVSDGQQLWNMERLADFHHAQAASRFASAQPVAFISQIRRSGVKGGGKSLLCRRLEYAWGAGFVLPPALTAHSGAFAGLLLAQT
jgi:hypothetical protein